MTRKNQEMTMVSQSYKYSVIPASIVDLSRGVFLDHWLRSLHDVAICICQKRPTQRVEMNKRIEFPEQSNARRQSLHDN